MLHRVGEGLLDDPERGELDARGQRARLAVGPQPHVEARVPVAGDQRRHVAQRGLGLEDGRRGVGARDVALAVGPEDADGPAHLAQRVAARRLDLARRLGRGVRVAPDQAAGGAGLDDHHADAVGDDVVHLAGDPGPLLADRQPGLLVAVALGSYGALLDHLDLFPPRAAAVAEHPHGGEDQDADRHVAPRAVRRIARVEHGHRLDEEHRRQPQAAARGDPKAATE